MYKLIVLALSIAAVSVVLWACGDPEEADENDEEVPSETVRVATFNTSLFRSEAGALIDDLSDPDYDQARQLAEIIQVNQPDILFLNEFDYDEDHDAARLFNENFLAEAQGDEDAVEYPHVYAFASNTGVPSGHDLDDNGTVGTTVGTEDYGNDAFGFGLFEGQYAFAIFSKYPLLDDEVRTFQEFLWTDMPYSMMPIDYYGTDATGDFRLSSKNHVDMPIEIGDHRLHLLGSHPTPPSFDGPEQRNLRRNQDEIRLWHDYIRPDYADYIYDDEGTTGGLAEDAYFVIVGDLNADPNDSDDAGSVAELLADSRTTDPEPASAGAESSGESGGGENDNHTGEHQFDTAEWNPDVGNMRADYVIPSSNLVVEDSATFWPAPDAPYADLVTVTDHRLVWVDITLGAE